ncbi:hypothetical protein [Kribbella sp. CA-294648]|uniref:hypothetical protein n=1 Tax=Kribbella sp. CA-294648 TaxID=3239948 RepID=UPI003D8D27E3
MPTREEVLASVEMSLRFLEQLGRGGPRRADGGIQTTLAYSLGETFVEVELDWREQAVFVLVGWCQDGEIPDGYYVDGHGTQVRHHLAAVLEHGEPTDQAAARRLDEAVKRSGPEAMIRQIDAFSDVLRAVHPRLPALLPNLPPRR